MDIRLLEKDDIPQAKALWKEAFGDSDKFIEWYFANKLLPGNSLGMFDGQLVSVVHMIPFQISVQGRPLQSAFIAGAATAKSRQGQGLMRTLLLDTLKLLKTRGIVMTHLYPFKHSFYENFGWATYSYVYNRNEKAQEHDLRGDVIETGDWRLLAPLYDNMMSGFDGYIIRNEREWKWRLEEHMTDGGRAALLIKEGTPAAYMLYNSNDGKAEAIEAVYSEEVDILPLLRHISEQGSKRAHYFVPAAETKNAIPYGMARVVDAQALLKIFETEDILKYIRISDDFADWNNIGEGTNIDINISSLAAIVHQGAKDIMYESKNSICNELLKKVFILRATCIFEQY